VQSELALALALPKNDPAADSPRALVSVGDAVGRAGTLETDMTFPAACRLARRKMPMLFAPWFARLSVPLPAATVRIVASVLPRDALDLEPGPDDAGFQVYV
jgi:hypothetical protein